MNSDLEIKGNMQKLEHRSRVGSILMLVAVVLLAVVPIVEYFTLGNNWEKGYITVLRIVGGIFLLIYGLIVRFSARGRLKDIISSSFVPQALGKVFSQLEYEQNKHIPEQSICEALIPHYWESTSGNDYVKADYHGLSVEFSDISLTYETGSGDDRHTRSAFRGLYIICSIADSFPAELVIVDRKKFKSRVKRACKELQAVTAGFEDFDEKLLLFTDNPQAALSILTMGASDSLLRLHEFTGDCGSIKVTHDGKLHIAVNSGRSLFEPCKRIEEIEQRIDEETQYVTSILDIARGAF